MQTKPESPKFMPDVNVICRGCVKKQPCDTSNDYLCPRFKEIFFSHWNLTTNFWHYLLRKDDENA